MDKIQFREIAHLYLGCEVEVDRTSSNQGKVIGKLIGIETIEKITWYVCYYNNNKQYHHQYPIRPILRPLSDMTEEELRCVMKFKECGNMNMVFQKRIKTSDSNGAKYAQWFFVYNDEENIIANLSDSANGLSIYGGNNYYRCYMMIIPYLFKQGFDIFGLIESGQAIQKK